MIKPLTSLRFFFALIVFFSHLSFLSTSNSKVVRFLYNFVFQEGQIGVSFFFILSGFILAHTYQASLTDKTRTKTDFYIARFARIFPLHVLTFLIAIPLSLKYFMDDKILWAKQAFVNFFLLQSFVPKKLYYFSFNAPAWSISNEIFFYLMFPILIYVVLFVLGKKIGARNIFLILFLILLPLFIVLIPKNYHHQFIYINPLFRIFDFVIGIILFNVHKWTISRKFSVNYSLLEFSALFILGIFFIFHPRVPLVLRFSIYYWVPMCLVVFVFSFQIGIVSKLLSNKILILLGEISFGFYMIHYLAIKYFTILNDDLLHIGNEYLITLVLFVAITALSYASFKWFETPMNKYIKKRLS